MVNSSLPSLSQLSPQCKAASGKENIVQELSTRLQTQSAIKKAAKQTLNSYYHQVTRAQSLQYLQHLVRKHAFSNVAFDCQYSVKIIVAGDSQVGKSSFITRYISDKFDPVQNMFNSQLKVIKLNDDHNPSKHSATSQTPSAPPKVTIGVELVENSYNNDSCEYSAMRNTNVRKTFVTVSKHVLITNCIAYFACLA